MATPPRLEGRSALQLAAYVGDKTAERRLPATDRIESPADLTAWAEGLWRWGNHVAVQAALAAARPLSTRSLDTATAEALDAVQAWVRDPSQRHLERCVTFMDRQDELPAWAHELTNAVHCGPRRTWEQLGGTWSGCRHFIEVLEEASRVLGEQATRRAVQKALRAPASRPTRREVTQHRALLAEPSLAWLDAFVRTWYATALAPGQGTTSAALSAAETRLGASLPGTLKAWYLLVGARLDQVLDIFVMADELRSGRRGRVLVWHDHIGVATASVSLTRGDDPPVHLEVEGRALRTTTGRLVQLRLSEFLRAQLARDVLDLACEGRAALGALGPEVRGGPLGDPDLVRRHAPLGLGEATESWGALRGDAETLVSPVAWATASAAAHMRFLRKR